MTKDKIEIYFAARESLLELFGVEWPELIEDYAHCEWVGDGNEINYVVGDDVYGFDSATLIGESEGYVLYSVYNNGNKLYVIFHTDKKLTDEDEIDEKFGW